MAIIDLFSKRQRRLRGEVADVFSYDDLPQPLRVQVVHIFQETLGVPGYQDRVAGCYKMLTEFLCREYGVFRLDDSHQYQERDHCAEYFNFILGQKNVEHCLDAIELGCRAVDKMSRDPQYRRDPDANEKADAALAEINGRFRERGVGYRYESGELVRVDSEFLHQEAVKPALKVLQTKEFAGAQEEFLKAHEHHRKKDNKEALNEALKAFESTLKIIAKKRKWKLKDRPTSKDLVDAAFKANLIPEFWQSQFGGLRSILEGGIPTGRNRLSGHGQGDQPIKVPDEIAAYVLHLTAAAILFLVRSDESLK